MGAAVESMTPVVDAQDRVSALTVVFDEAMDPGEFTADDVTVTSPLGTAVPMAGDPIDSGDGLDYKKVCTQGPVFDINEVVL